MENRCALRVRSRRGRVLSLGAERQQTREAAEADKEGTLAAVR